MSSHDMHETGPDCDGPPRDASDTFDVHLADGSSVRLRAACHDDDAFRRLFFSLSDTSRYLYFCAGVPSTAQWAERFATLSRVDGIQAYVLVAEVQGEVIGFARFSQDSHADPQARTVDVGILLTDAWQGRGLGGKMLCRLATEARRMAIQTFSASALWENRRIVRLARRIFPEMHITCRSGSCDITVAL
jgi:RimJ/RimL family protein N-acetyltransferase